MNNYLEFDNSLVTGNAEIDEQHKEWIDRINKLLGGCEGCGGKVEAIKMLDYMADYADFHFQAEEKLQEEVEYPAINEHKAKHEEFRKAVGELYEMLQEEEGPTPAFVEAVRKNVVNWLVNHIKSFDVSVASYINMKLEPDRI